MKKLIVAMLLMVIAFSFALMISPARATGTATISVSSATQQFPSANVGDSIQVNITVSNVQNLWGWQISGTRFNPAVLSLTKVAEGPFLQQAGQTMFSSTSSDSYAVNQGDLTQMYDILISTSGVSGSGVIATLTFTVLATGTSQLNFTATSLVAPPPSGSTTGVPIACNALNVTLTIGSSTNTSSPTSGPAITSPSSSPNSSSNPKSGDNSPRPTGLSQAPEFSATVVIVPLMAVTALIILGITRNLNQHKKTN